MNTLLPDLLENYAYEHSGAVSDELIELEETTKKELKYSEMLSGRVVANLLQIVMQLSGARRVLEIGTFTGYSALAMAEVLPNNGHIITCEMNERYEEIARRHWNRSPHRSKIELRMGNALEIMDDLKSDEPFDMLFLDADKNRYPEYYEKGLALLKTGGVMLIDNVLWSGRVAEDQKDDKSEAIDRTNLIATSDSRVQNVLLTVRDGVQLIYKK